MSGDWSWTFSIIIYAIWVTACEIDSSVESIKKLGNVPSGSQLLWDEDKSRLWCVMNVFLILHGIHSCIIYIYIYISDISVKWLITINRIQNKSFC